GSVTPAKVDPTLDIATDGRVVALLDVNEVVALDYTTGAEKWRTRFPLAKADYNAGNIKAGKTVWTGTVIVKDGVIVHASPNNLAGLDVATGKILWTRPKRYLQHLWFEWKDVFVIDGLVWTWSAELKREKLDGAKGASTWPATANAYDLHSGELVRQVDLGKVFKTHHHHRCYRNKATVNYILASRRGTEFIDLRHGKHSINNWVRGTCHLGMMPANGLQYAPPHPCVCYLQEKLNGFQALAGETHPKRRPHVDAPVRRLVKGSAFGAVGPDATDDDWPAFRGDSLLSGSAVTDVPPQPTLLWQSSLGAKPAAPLAVGDRLFVPLPDSHTLLALDAREGRMLWHFTADARIDSPPTYYKGALLLGSSDGWVYCLEAATGRLAWKFRAAPAERFIAAFGRLESAWPVHGSILVMNDTAYFAAGRSSQLDGGLYLFGLDPGTGQVRHERRIDGPHYTAADVEQNFQLPMGVLPDIMQGRDNRIYMRGKVFDAQLKDRTLRPVGDDNWIHAKAGLLDDAYFKRTPWSLGADGPWARLVVRDADAAYAIRMFDSLQGLNPDVYFTPAKEGYLLFATETNTGKRRWRRRIGIRVNAMAASRSVLFAAGCPDIVDPADPLGAFEGRKGGRLVAIDKQTGQTLWQYDLPSPPVFHGIAASRGRLHLTMQDGRIACFGK
ncbi:MAG: outer membrane protein assembly factor BamB family protein, partial [Planctomycetota bacterium]